MHYLYDVLGGGLWGGLGGGIIAAGMTMFFTMRRDEKERKMSIFRTLMKHRNNRLHSEAVEALNLVEVIFYGKKAILEAREDFQKLVSCKASQGDKEFDDKVSKLYFDLVFKIGKSLAYKDLTMNKITKPAYLPQLHANYQNSQIEIQKRLLEVLNQKQPIWIADWKNKSKNKPKDEPKVS